MRVVFLGSGAFGLPTFDRIRDAFEVPLVVSQPDRPAGRGRQDTPTPIATRALDDADTVELVRTASVNDSETLDRIERARPDALVVIAFGQKIGPELLDRYFAVNLHASLLPRWRGAAPINRAMMAGDKTTGVSVISLAERMDAGEVHTTRRLEIDPGETAGELHDRLALLGPDAVEEVLRRRDRGEVRSTSQDESEVTHAAKLHRRDGTVDLDLDATAVRARIHGLAPWPGCDLAVRVDGTSATPDRLRIHRVGSSERTDLEAGTLLPDGTLGCGIGAVRLLEVQAPGGRMLDWASFTRGRGLPENARLEQLHPEAGS